MKHFNKMEDIFKSNWQWKLNKSPSLLKPKPIFLFTCVCWCPLAVCPHSCYHSVRGVCMKRGPVSRQGGHVTHFQIMAGFCLPSPLQQAQFANSSIHLQAHHAPAGLCSLITPKLQRRSPNNYFPYTNLFQYYVFHPLHQAIPYLFFFLSTYLHRTSHDNSVETNDQMFHSLVSSPRRGGIIVIFEVCGKRLPMMNSEDRRWRTVGAKMAVPIWSPWVVCPV